MLRAFQAPSYVAGSQEHLTMFEHVYIISMEFDTNT